MRMRIRILLFTLVRIRILLVTSMRTRIRILPFTSVRIRNLEKVIEILPFKLIQIGSHNTDKSIRIRTDPDERKTYIRIQGIRIRNTGLLLGVVAFFSSIKRHFFSGAGLGGKFRRGVQE